MNSRPAKPSDTPWISPYLTVRDTDAALEFYQKAFGFEKKMAMPGPDGKSGHAEMTWQGALIMLGCETAGCPSKAPSTSGARSPVALYIYCEDVDALHQRAVAAGATSEMQPTDMFWGDRICSVTDPDGHVWHLATNVAEFDPSKVPYQQALSASA